MNDACKFSQIAAAMLGGCAGVASGDSVRLEWSRCADLPDKLGVAAPFAGSSRKHLIVAGGANFPAAMPWEGGKKVWHERIWALDLQQSDARWQEAGKLPHPLAYGVSLTIPEGVLCVGGSDAERHHSGVFLLSWGPDGTSIREWPPLPVALAHASGAVLVDGRVVIVGGAEKPGEQLASAKVFVIDSKDAAPAWSELPPFPGKPRIMPVTGAVANTLFVFGGAALEPDAAGKVRRVLLKDAWRYTDDAGWKPLAELPKPVVAAASPAPFISGELLAVSGDDGSRTGFQPLEKHPGFPDRILAFRPETNAWRDAGITPAPRATLPVAALPSGGFVFPSGEVRPGVRSPEVWMLKPIHTP